MADRRTVWLFDLDNTLHNAGASAFRYFDGAMNRYIEEQLQVSPDEADRLRADYWHRYGSTLLGLIRHHGVRPSHFVRHTHAFPGLERELVGHPHDLAALRRLTGRKIVLTNAGRDYALRVLKALRLDGLFDEVIGIEQMRLFGQIRPKPDARMFKALAARLGVHPSRCVLVEDTLLHQRSARSVGMRTVWMQRWVKHHAHGPEVGVYLHRRPPYVCARIKTLQQLRRLP
ncbi:pyrimidine 5'-nucleotidase [Ideonella sp. 4Y16]|uniref:pyrimidine 5'-nucleotidase n=1 Tax=Ideonella alba TaxID=2824118 RepID=UPI001B363A73|nr:pyrimidine 5'-nucleotidase [Ideonella alba]MBQ0944239.1 pyrimidine 5'-nucleotidase [Ideonella alba]